MTTNDHHLTTTQPPPPPIATTTRHPNPAKFPEKFPADRLLPHNGLFIGEGKHRKPNARRASELVFQLIRSARLKEAAAEVRPWCC